MADHWVVLKINGPDPHYRLAMSWKGGYINPDSWRLNSGIVKVEGDNPYNFHGSSGSVYSVDKDRYGLDMMLANLLESLKRHGEVEVLPEDTDWFSIDWIIDKEGNKE